MAVDGELMNKILLLPVSVAAHSSNKTVIKRV